MKILTAGQKEFWYFDELESTLTELCLLGTRFIEKTGNFENPTFHQFTKVKRKMHVVWIRIRIFRIQFGARSELIWKQEKGGWNVFRAKQLKLYNLCQNWKESKKEIGKLQAHT